MGQGKEKRELRGALFIILIVASIILFVGSIYMVKQFAVLWGLGAGSAVQSTTDNTVPVQALQPIASNLGLFHVAIDVSYVLAIMSLILCITAVIMFVHRKEGYSIQTRTYGLLHSALIIFYALILVLLLSSYLSYLTPTYLYVIYFGIGLGICCNAYMQYDIRDLYPLRESRRTGSKNAISMDPSTPFSNVLNLQEEVFSKMAGHLGIVDKHFNSSALANLHRIIANNLSNFTKITILTSKEMLDGNFATSALDFAKELGGSGINAEFRIMEDKDSAEQHERFIMDEKIAYKIPPFNIINKKSEHITKIKHSEAKSRFYYLYGRASTIDNYLTRKAHDEQKPS